MELIIFGFVCDRRFAVEITADLDRPQGQFCSSGFLILELIAWLEVSIPWATAVLVVCATVGDRDCACAVACASRALQKRRSEGPAWSWTGFGVGGEARCG